MWYLDTDCNNHMTNRKDLFIKLDNLVRKSVRFVDNNIITYKGI